MVEEDRYCVDISNQILATQALLKRINKEILEAHIRHCAGRAAFLTIPTQAGRSAPVGEDDVLKGPWLAAKAVG